MNRCGMLAPQEQIGWSEWAEKTPPNIQDESGVSFLTVCVKSCSNVKTCLTGSLGSYITVGAQLKADRTGWQDHSCGSTGWVLKDSFGFVVGTVTAPNWILVLDGEDTRITIIHSPTHPQPSEPTFSVPKIVTISKKPKMSRVGPGNFYWIGYGVPRSNSQTLASARHKLVPPGTHFRTLS